jgi:hypothetical protein
MSTEHKSPTKAEAYVKFCEERDAKLKEDAEKRLEHEADLDMKYSAKLGVRGIDFEIVNTAKGVFVLRKPDWTVAKKYNSIPADKQTDEDVWNYVVPHIVEPDVNVARAVMQEHGGVAYRCAGALHSLYGARGPGDRTGKF